MASTLPFPLHTVPPSADHCGTDITIRQPSIATERHLMPMSRLVWHCSASFGVLGSGPCPRERRSNQLCLPFLLPSQLGSFFGDRFPARLGDCFPTVEGCSFGIVTTQTSSRASSTILYTWFLIFPIISPSPLSCKQLLYPSVETGTPPAGSHWRFPPSQLL